MTTTSRLKDSGPSRAQASNTLRTEPKGHSSRLCPVPSPGHGPRGAGSTPQVGVADGPAGARVDAAPCRGTAPYPQPQAEGVRQPTCRTPYNVLPKSQPTSSDPGDCRSEPPQGTPSASPTGVRSERSERADGFLAGVGESERAPRCIASCMVDGGTTFALDVGRGVLEQHSGVSAPRAFLRCLSAIRVPRTAEQERRDRQEGGRYEYLPLPQVELDERTGGTRAAIPAKVRVSGDRRQRIVLELHDCAYIRVNVESGAVSVQMKAKQLWLLGASRAVERYVGLVSWWVTGEDPGLSGYRRLGWRTTSLEMCSDYVGLSFLRLDVPNIIGFRKSAHITDVGDAESLQTINVGSRASRVSMCIYDKDRQLEEVRGGNDSTYRRVHERNGWRGEERRRVEFRLNTNALTFTSDEDEIDLRDPAVLCNETARRRVWAILTAKRRLILPGTDERRTRCKTDPRWLAVEAAADIDLRGSYRQDRQAQTDTWDEARKRAVRDFIAAKDRIRVLHDIDEETPDAIVAAVVAADAAIDPETVEASERRRQRYGDVRSEYMGREIRELGPAQWAAMVRAVDGRAAEYSELPEVFVSDDVRAASGAESGSLEQS